MDKPEIAFIGCGKLGLPAAEVFAEHYHVTGYDVVPRSPSNFKMAATVREAVVDKQFVFIAVQTPHHKDYDGTKPSTDLPAKDFNYEPLKEVIKEVMPHLQTGVRLIVISTVLPGTFKTIIQPLIRSDIEILYNPYLIAMGTVKEDMVNPEMIIIGSNTGEDTGSIGELMDLYKPMVKPGTRYETGTWEEAESIKIFYNTFISMKLSVVNMIQDVAEKLGNMNAEKVTTALANSTYRITGKAYMNPGMGDGGPCHPRDNIALRELSERLNLGYDIFGAIMYSREQQAMNMAKRALAFSKNVIIMGKTYKPGVSLTDGSYSILIGHYVQQLGGNLQYYSPETQETKLVEVESPVYIISFPATWVDEYQYPNHCTVLDPWRKFTTANPTITVVHYGNTRGK